MNLQDVGMERLSKNYTCPKKVADHSKNRQLGKTGVGIRGLENIYSEGLPTKTKRGALGAGIGKT